MSKHKQYATSNEALHDKYWDTDNVVTRNTYYNIFIHRAERGDYDAQAFANAIYVAKSSKSSTDKLFSDEELNFVVTNAMIPWNITDIVDCTAVDNGNMEYPLNGDLVILDEYDQLIVDGQYRDCTVSDVIEVIEEHDPLHTKTVMLIDPVVSQLTHDSKYSVMEYISQCIAIKDFLGPDYSGTSYTLTSCDIAIIKDAVNTIATLTPARIIDAMSKSQMPDKYTSNLTSTRSLVIEHVEPGNLLISHPTYPGVVLHVEQADGNEGDQYILKVVEDFTPHENDWGLNDCTESVPLYVAGLLSTVTVMLKDIVYSQEDINGRIKPDVIVYNPLDADSVLSAVIAAYVSDQSKNLACKYVSVSDDIDYSSLVNKTVCFMDCKYDSDAMLKIASSAKCILHFNPEETVDVITQNTVFAPRLDTPAVDAWKYYIGDNVPFPMNILSNDSDDYLSPTLRRAILNNKGLSLPDHLMGLIKESINTMVSTSRDSRCLDEFIRLIDEEEVDEFYGASNIVDLRFK